MSLPFDEDLGSYRLVCLVSLPEIENAANLPEHNFWTNKGDKGDEIARLVKKGMKMYVIYLAFSKALTQSPRESFHPIWKGMAYMHGKLVELPASKAQNQRLVSYSQCF